MKVLHTSYMLTQISKYNFLQCERKKLIFFFIFSLYGGAQSELLPYDKFQWMSNEEISNTDFLELNAEGSVGCTLEVDLSYPKHLHQTHDSFPLCPETLTVQFNNLSPYSQESFKQNEGHEKYESEKLTATFLPRKKYVVSLKNLQLYCSLGMKLEKVHRGVKYRQRKFLKSYIDMCTRARKNCNSDFKRNMYTLLANAVYGKFIEDPRKYCKVVLAQTKKQAMKAVSSPFYKSHSIISKDIVSFCLENKEVVLDKPFAIGFAILENSKHFMYDFWYNTIIKTFGQNVELLFSDTDSFCMSLFCPKGYTESFKKISKHFDFSNYDPSHPFYSKKNEKALGFFKDELKGKISATKFCGLRSKCYAIQFENNTQKLVCKGIGRTVVNKNMHFDQYYDVLMNTKTVRETFPVIESKKHSLSTVLRKKKALSNFDSKRFILPCGIHSYPHGSVLISKFKGKCIKCKKVCL